MCGLRASEWDFPVKNDWVCEKQMEKLIILQEDGIPHSLCYARMRSLMEQPAVNMELKYVIQKSKDWIELRKLIKASSFSSSYSFQNLLPGRWLKISIFKKTHGGYYLAHTAQKDRAFGKSASAEGYFHVTTSSVSTCAEYMQCKPILCGLQWAAHVKN